MATPPTPTTRGTPSGVQIPDGLASYITVVAGLSGATINFWEKTVQPPAIDGGEPTDLTNMHNAFWRTSHPKILKTLGPTQASVGYDPNVVTTILGTVNVPGTITVTFPDAGTLAFYGYLQKFEPEALKEGEEPMANVTIVATNRDATGLEAGPVYASGSGTA